MFLDKVLGEGTNHIDPQGIFLGILKCRRNKFQSNSFTAQALGNLCMPDRHPAMTICLEFQIADQAILFDLKPALGDPRLFAHPALAFS